jgi:hypothetical protein
MAQRVSTHQQVQLKLVAINQMIQTAGTCMRRVLEMIGEFGMQDESIIGFLVDQLVAQPRLLIGTYDTQLDQLVPDPELVKTCLDSEVIDRVSVWVDHNLSWQAITGSHARVSTKLNQTRT